MQTSMHTSYRLLRGLMIWTCFAITGTTSILAKVCLKLSHARSIDVKQIESYGKQILHVHAHKCGFMTYWVMISCSEFVHVVFPFVYIIVYRGGPSLFGAVGEPPFQRQWYDGHLCLCHPVGISLFCKSLFYSNISLSSNSYTAVSNNWNLGALKCPITVSSNKLIHNIQICIFSTIDI